MCIAIYKPKGKTIEEKTLKTSWDNNKDGAGYMYNHNGLIIGKKGFMTYQELIQDLSDNKIMKKNKIAKNIEIVIHFRIATHGGIEPGKCHPFPASDNIEKLHSLNWKDNCGIAHNGIVHEYAEKNLSDTQGFIQKVLSSPVILNNLDNDSIKELIKESTIGSKFVIMNKDKVYLFGNWINDKGVFFSNNSYIPYIWKDDKTDLLNWNYENDPLSFWQEDEVKLISHCSYFEDCNECPYMENLDGEKTCIIWRDHLDLDF
jgi:predicted glutamine amidotransferase